LKRQREARNFKYKGDANAPRQTRSGRVVREVDAEGVDEFGEMDIEPAYEAEAEEEEEVEVIEEPMDVVEEAGSGRGPRWNNEPEVRGMDMVELEEETVSAVSPLSPFARLHVANILSTITSQSISSDPGPFHDEVQNEALQGLLKLLQGTVERGEGNSAIVTGPRGVGKTRVSLFSLSSSRGC
jgi:origin recognition complex subunit 4